MIDTILAWFGIVVGYVIACALIAGGGYLAIVLGENPLNPTAKLCRYAGFVLVIAGVILGTLNIGKTIGAQECQAQRKTDALNGSIARLHKEAAVKSVAADTSETQAQELSSDNDGVQKSIEEYKAQESKLSAALIACRMPSDADDARLRDITGAGVSHP